MRKLLGYMILLACVLIYALSSHRGLMRTLNIYKTTTNGSFRSDRRYGDLYGRCYLAYFRKNFHHTGSSLTAASCGLPKQIDLYQICDSYVWMFGDSAKYYCGVSKLVTAKTNQGERLSVVLDSSKVNVLLLEMAERNIRTIFHDSLYIKNMVRRQTVGTQTTIDQPPANQGDAGAAGTGQQTSQASNLKAKIKDLVFNKDINTNLESTLWDVSWFTPIKEFKAALNYNLLGVVDKGVYLSTDRRRLYFNETIDTATYSSAFKPITNGEVDSIVNKLNALYAQARATGFQKVYFSIIPNPVSLLEPRYRGMVYNQLVERIQHAPGLKMPCINVLPSFNKLKDSVYASSDTHWTFFGAQVWLDQFNQELSKAARER